MAALQLKTQTGRELGSPSARRLRREGKVPGVVYGLGTDPVSIAVEWPDLRAALTTDAGLNALITLDVAGDQQLSIVKDIQRHPVRRDVIHVDFIRIDPNAEIEVDVPLTLVGDAREVTDNNGMVDQVMFTLAVYCKPDAIPTEIEADISALTIGESVRVAEISLPAGTRTEVDEEEAVAVGTVTRSTLEAMAAEEAADEAAEGEAGEGGDAADDGGDDAGGDDGGDDSDGE